MELTMSKAKSRRILNLGLLAIATVMWVGVAAMLLVVLDVIFPDIFSERSSDRSRVQVSDHPRVQVQVKSLPSVNEAIRQSIELSTPLRLFGVNDRHWNNPEIMIAATKKSDVLIDVIFSIAPTRNGKFDIKPLFEVVFIVSDKPSSKWSTGDLDKLRVDDPKSVAISKALLAVISLYRRDPDETEYTIVVSVAQQDDGFYVHKRRYPYIVGGHGGYKLSKSFKIIRVVHGA